MGGGGKSRSTTNETTVELPPGLERGANEVLAAGMRAAALPYSPNRGVTIASLTPQQGAAIRGSDQMASALGLPSTGGMANYGITMPEYSAAGPAGYSTGSLYDDMVMRSMSAEDEARRANLLQNYERAGQGIYETAGITPVGGGATTTNPVAPTPAPEEDPYDVAHPGDTGGMWTPESDVGGSAWTSQPQGKQTHGPRSLANRSAPLMPMYDSSRNRNFQRASPRAGGGGSSGGKGGSARANQGNFNPAAPTYRPPSGVSPSTGSGK